MIRTEITLEKHEYELARKEARALGISVAEFVRRTIRDKLAATGQRPWMRFAGMVDARDRDATGSIDETVYG